MTASIPINLPPKYSSLQFCGSAASPRVDSQESTWSTLNSIPRPSTSQAGPADAIIPRQLADTEPAAHEGTRPRPSRLPFSLHVARREQESARIPTAHGWPGAQTGEAMTKLPAQTTSSRS